jgi:hypothetical protein
VRKAPAPAAWVANAKRPNGKTACVKTKGVKTQRPAYGLGSLASALRPMAPTVCAPPVLAAAASWDAGRPQPGLPGAGQPASVLPPGGRRAWALPDAEQRVSAPHAGQRASALRLKAPLAARP